MPPKSGKIDQFQFWTMRFYSDLQIATNVHLTTQTDQMKSHQILLAFFFALSCSNFAFGQSSTDIDMAHELAAEAIELMDNGEFESSITKLEAAKVLDPSNYVYDYEIAFAYNLQERFPEAIEILEKLIKQHENFNDQCFQNLGNYYDLNGQPDKAMEAYERGIQKFPNSGRIYLEMGVVTAHRKKNFGEALAYWEKGIEVDPFYPSNYFHATTVLSASDQKMWAILYGEAFLLLEPSGERHKAVSKRLFDLYNSCVKIEKSKKKDFSVEFCTATTMELDAPSDGKLPLCLNYELIATVGLAIAIDKKIKKAKELDFDAIVFTRTTFLSLWLDKELDKEFPLAVFDFEKQVKDAGHLDAYQRWLVMHGDINAFEAYLKANEVAFRSFWDWFRDKSIEFDEENGLIRSRY